MSDGLNRVFLLGHLGADPELRFAPSGTAKLQLRLATNASYVDKDGRRQERTDWHNVVIWGKRAEGLAKYLCCGSGLMVEGELRTSSYEKDGQKRYWTEVVATDIRFTSSKRASSPPLGDDLDGNFGRLPPLPRGPSNDSRQSFESASASL